LDSTSNLLLLLDNCTDVLEVHLYCCNWVCVSSKVRQQLDREATFRCIYWALRRLSNLG